MSGTRRLLDVLERVAIALNWWLERLVGRFPTREERLAEEERRAWDGAYDAALLAILGRGQLYGAGEPGAGVNSREAQSMDAGVYADAKLEQRRYRFGAGKEAPKPCLLAVTEDLLARTIEALVGDSGAEERAVLAQQLRALVSE